MLKLFRINLRAKLLLVSLSLLVIPWIGYQYVQEMESFLRKGQQEALLSTASAIATILNERPALFRKQGDVLQSAKRQQHLYVRPLKSRIQLDGYDEDWVHYKDRERRFGKKHILSANAVYNPDSFSFSQIVGSYNKYLYVLFKVNDERIIYRNPSSLRLDRNDHLQIALQSPDGTFARYIIATTGPGWVNAHRMPLSGDEFIALAPEVRIKGEWQETKTGYILEIRIPLSMIGSKLAFAIADVDDRNSGKIKTVIGTSGTDKAENLSSFMLPSPEMEQLLKSLQHNDARIWIIDNHNRVLAISGTLKDPPKQTNEDQGIIKGIMRTIYRFILKQPVRDFQDDLSAASTLNSTEVKQALTGKPAIHWRQSPDKRISIMSAAQPVWHQKKVIGAVVMERTSNSILILQNRAMENLFNLSLLVFLVATVALLYFATRLSGRVMRLRNEAEKAISSDGRVTGGISGSSAGDEIGDLSRSFSDVLTRLSQYTRYLETMASKLSHELRTPLTVVKSSLDNLDMIELDPDAKTYTTRASEGLARLSNILNRMSEASRLEQSIQQAELEDFDLAEVVRGCYQGYCIAYPEQKFEYHEPGQPVMMHGVPDLIAQMLDKLVANAVDFSPDDQSVRLSLLQQDKDIVLTVDNSGPVLPENMQHNLFDSMVSVRENRNDELHLGLGLHIVRLISEFHQGNVSADNRKDNSGVIFSVRFPAG